MEALCPRLGNRGRGGLAGAILVAALALTVSLPSPASAWKYVFNDFFDAEGGGIGAAHAVAKKCQGGKLGHYKFVSIAVAEGGDTKLKVEIHADLPVFAQWKPLKQPKVEIQSSDNFDPAVIAEIASAYGDFLDGIETKWSPGELLFKHPELVIFGNQILSEGKHLEDFKPKNTC